MWEQALPAVATATMPTMPARQIAKVTGEEIAAVASFYSLVS